MGGNTRVSGSEFASSQQPALRFLVESALRKVISSSSSEVPRDRNGWVELLTDAIASDSDTHHESVIATMMANGVSSEELFEFYVPAVARRIGEYWVKDKASFVEVTVGAARLQALFRMRPNGTRKDFDGTIPLGEPVIMLVPDFEDHALGAFVAADQLRRHGLWVHMGIRMSREELVDLLSSRSFSLLGITSATLNALEKVTSLVDYLRTQLDSVPPIVVGGRIVKEPNRVVQRTGADFAVRSAREAVEKCGLSTVGSGLAVEGLK